MKRKRILAFSLVLVLLFTRAGGFNPPVSVYGAGFGTTVAEYIVTLLASVNMAITEPVTLNNINASFGNLALNTVTQAELQTAVNSFNTAMGSSTLIDSFATTALEAQQYINVTGTEFLNGYQIAATSGADNLLASISNYNTTGVMAPVAGAATYIQGAGAIIGAIGAGVGLGIMINNLRENINNYISRHLPLNSVVKFANNNVDGVLSRPANNTYYNVTVHHLPSSGLISGYYYDPETSTYRIAVINNTTSQQLVQRLRGVTLGNGSGWGSNMKVNSGAYLIVDQAYNNNLEPLYGYNFGNIGNVIALSGKVGTVMPSFNNGIIGENGNITSVDEIKPSYDEENQTYKPINWNDYMNMVNNANNNTNNIPNNFQNISEDNTLQDIVNDAIQENGEEFNNTVAPYIEEIATTESANPDYVPQQIVPEQPTIPEKPEVSTEDKEVALIGYADNIQNVFPFCIPYDLRDMVKGLIAEREAPRIQWTFQSNLFGFEYTFDIDLSEWDEAASILRLMELIAFVIGLAMVTRYIIGA